MAHNIETMAWAGETPWHGLGTKVGDHLSPTEMLEAAQLNWEVLKKPLSYRDAKGAFAKTEHSALVRSSDNRLLSVIPNDWNPVQNSEAFDFFNDFVHDGDMEMHTAGSLQDGNIVWALAKVKESFALFNGKDQVDSYLLFSNPHRYGQSIDIRFTPIRVVCNNTLTLSLSRKADLAVRLNHRREFDAAKVKETMGIAHSKLEQYRDVAQHLSSKSYTQETVMQYLTRVFPKTSSTEGSASAHLAAQNAANDDLKISRAAKLSYESLGTQPGADFGKGTWWSAFNAVTFNIDHVLGHSPETRLASSWYGPNRARKTAAMELAVEYANAA